MKILKLRNKTSKTVAVVLSTCLVCGIVGGVAYSANNNSVYDSALENAKAANSSADAALAAINGNGSGLAGEAKATKEETVYVMTNAQGMVQKVIVSAELRNPSGAASLKDKSSLRDITNLKGSETFKQSSDGTITWDAQGKDIYYQGTTDKALPINVKVTYKLDGKEIKGEDLAGKSGKVVIRYDYSIDKKVISEKGDTVVPFLTLTAIMLDNEKFSNITVSNGKIVDDGDRSVVVGFALPGISEALNIEKDSDKVPEYVEISADAKDFSIGSTMTYASCDFANDIDTKNIKNVDDLTGALDQVSGAVNKLTNGSTALYEGLCTLLQKSGEMSNGIGTLYSGATQLETGLSSLDSNSAALKSGAYQVFSTLTSTAQTQLNAALAANGYSPVTLTPENYSTVLGGMLDSFSGGAYSKAKAAAEAKIRPAVEAAVREQVTAGVKETVKASLIEKGYTEEQAAMYLQSGEGTATVNTYVEQKMASDEIKQTIESNVASKLASEEVQSQINSAVSEGLSGNSSYTAIKSLKASLDSYAAFYSGLSAYTSGVSSAAKGAKQVAGGLSQLKTGGESLVSGVTKLRDGAMQLSDGMNQFVTQLSSKLGSLSGSEAAKILPRVNSMLNAAKSYTNYSGIAEGTEGSVRFIIKTASIGD